ncbi:MAG: hypothetical protein [Caudoviricetes sp.]|nr:MAG: hypothetical protein [Caudoviricetes sp.]
MKYEIIKGSEKDFEQAPEWAKVKTKTFLYEFFLEHCGIGAKYINAEYPETVKITSTTAPNSDEEIIAERRPITEPVWDGEGLPPVGVECEHCPGGTTQAEWEVVKVLAINERPGGVFTDFWLQREDGSSYIIGNPYRFRPIRSPEDVARSNAIGEMERAYEELTGKPAREAEEYYDLIAAGKIIGIKLED